MAPESLALSPRRALFAREYLVDLNGTRAAIRAGFAVSSAARHAHDMLQSPDVRAAIDAAMAERVADLKVEGNDVLRMLLDVATADPNDVIQTRRLCCRHCWGNGFGYQRTNAEMDRDRKAHVADMARRQKEAEREDKDFTPTAFDEQGGVGYHKLREPNPDCPECFGEGLHDVHVTDSRLLTGPARRLFAGVKVTRDGFEVKLRDQDKAVELLGRHLALFTDRIANTGETELTQAIIAARRRSSKPEPGSEFV